jgi:pimeloyl-ACP methyl ester carboxylesterase
MEQRTSNGIGYITGGWPLDPVKSTLVFIHGAGGSGAFWSAQVQGLAARVNTVALDLPGHGRSGGGGKTKIEDYVRAVVDFIKQVDIPTPVPCGLSMGGAITQQLLLDCRDQVKAGILISTGARLKAVPAFFETMENDYNGFVNMFAKLVVSKKTDPALVLPFKEEMAGCKPEITHGDFRACDTFDEMQRVGSITSPVLVVSAEDDHVTPPKYGDFMEKSIAKASRVHIMEAGHIVSMEKPEEVNRAIIEFLDRTGL